MVEYLQDPLFSNERLGGISFINESLANFTYAIRLSYAPRNSGETELELFIVFHRLIIDKLRASNDSNKNPTLYLRVLKYVLFHA